MSKARIFFALIAARLVTLLIRLLTNGKGSSLPGKIALLICPELIRAGAARVRQGIILVTGTNGKTTTNNMIARILEGNGSRVLINREGANLLTGVATAFAREMDVLGRRTFDYACLEVDEAAFPQVAARLNPGFVVVTNFFRDQLDRYGETDKTVFLVQGALRGMAGAKLILNADDPLVARLGESSGLPAFYYGLAEHDGSQRQGSAAREARFCPGCGRELNYRYYQYSQLGDYQCPGCGFSRPEVDVEGLAAHSDGSSISCRAQSRQGSAIPLTVPLHGVYNLYNAVAAYTTALLLGVEARRAAHLLLGYRPAIGRMDRFRYQGKPVMFNLVKNPTGFNEALRSLLGLDYRQVDAMIAVNDNDADGRDISWLWDVDFEMLADSQDRFGVIVCSGQRGEEMALRLKYAGVAAAKLAVLADCQEAVNRVLDSGAPKSYILATYTALWPVERILSRHAKRIRPQAEYLPHVS